MASLFTLRRTEPDLVRTYRAPLYPVAPAFALGMACVALAAVIYCHLLILCDFSVP